MKICVFGAGSIGCYVGGRLLAGGADVSFVGRQRLADSVAASGLTITDKDGFEAHIDPGAVTFTTSAAVVAQHADVVLVTVKSAATPAAGAALAAVLRPGAIVVSLQNGIGNADVLREHLPAATVLAGMVMFNVVARGDGWFHQGSGGSLEVEDHPSLDELARAFDAATLPLLRRADIAPVQWAKLLLNLNNPINALSGLGLAAELGQRAFRRSFALAQQEALTVLAASGITPAKLTPLPPALLPRLLGVPDFVFVRVAKNIVDIDPLARSSMLDDLDAGRRTEIDWLSGEVVRRADRVGVPAPVNARLVEFVRAAENGGRRNWTGPDLLNALRSVAVR